MYTTDAFSSQQILSLILKYYFVNRLNVQELALVIWVLGEVDDLKIDLNQGCTAGYTVCASSTNPLNAI